MNANISCRTKRAAINFKDEIKCEPGKCTLIQCKVGPLEKGQVLTFKIRSRLFTETQIKVRVKGSMLFYCPICIIFILKVNKTCVLFLYIIFSF